MVEVKKIFENSNNIVFCTNNNYAPYMTVALKSLIDHTNPEKNYDIIVFETNVDPDLKKLIIDMGNDYPNISIRFINVLSVYDRFDKNKFFCHSYFSKEIYLRLFIPEVLHNYDRAIYLDCDVILQADIAELNEYDLGGAFIGAVRDYNSLVNEKVYPKMNSYFNEVIKIKDIKKYFNSGVLLMNLEPLRQLRLPDSCFEYLKTYKQLLYPDQDLLNLVLGESVKIIDNGWNFVFAINTALVQNNYFLEYAIEWSKGLANQKIIHYISEVKPWDSPQIAYADIWWNTAKTTPVYQMLLKAYFDKHPEHLK